MVSDSLDAYIASKQVADKSSNTPDAYILEFMNRLPTMNEPLQATIFERLLAASDKAFPWLRCFSLPPLTPVPTQFRDPKSAKGIVVQSLAAGRRWVSISTWVSDYAQAHGEQMRVANVASIRGSTWSAAALVARVDDSLTAEALKKRLDVAFQPTEEEMQALIDSCSHKRELKAVAVETILNLGFPDIALSSSNKPAEPTKPWKHWLIARDSVNLQAESAKPKWSLSKDGQWTAHASPKTWYLMLRYPLLGDFEIDVTAQQMSGDKFGIGCGGLAIVQRSESSNARCQGVGGRRGYDLISLESTRATDVPLKVRHQGSAWTIQAGAATMEETATDGVPLIYLVNQGSGVARITDWKLTNELKIARSADLLDSQLRLWSVVHGDWSLPTVRTKLPDDSRSKRSSCNLVDGVLTLNAIDAEESQASQASQAAMRCLRPLEPGETLSYEFQVLPELTTVHPMLGQMVFRLDAAHVQLQWLAGSTDARWLCLNQQQLVPIESKEPQPPINLKSGTWNKVQLQMDTARNVTIEINGHSVARVALPPEVSTEFGLTVVGAKPAQVRHVQLSGPWPEKLNLEQLQELTKD